MKDPVTETPARSGCTCPPRAGFGQERVHVTTNRSCALYRPPTNAVDELGQIRLLLQTVGLSHLTPSQGVRELISRLRVWEEMTREREPMTMRGRTDD